MSHDGSSTDNRPPSNSYPIHDCCPKAYPNIIANSYSTLFDSLKSSQIIHYMKWIR